MALFYGSFGRAAQDAPPKKKARPAHQAPSGLQPLQGNGFDCGLTQWNCSSSVEPVSAVTLDLPPWMAVVTSSK